MPLRSRIAVLSLALLAPPDEAILPAPVRPPERVAISDNLEPAGTLRDGVLTLEMDTRMGMWHPDGDDAPGATVPAFAAAGHAVQIPGPMIRVPAGTEVALTVKNSVPGATLTVHGLVSRPLAPNAPADTIQVAPGASRQVRFRLDAPGTFYYWGTTTGRTFFARTHEDAQLSGAIVVDQPGAAPARDRVLMIGLWADTAGSEHTRHHKQQLLVVNGRSWPHTTRLSYAVGDTVRWRVINAGADVHPMHLHGFYYLVHSRGDALRDSVYDDARRDRVVTDFMAAGRTMSMSWVPEREGNWLFHCHTVRHFEAKGPLGVTLPRPEGGGHAHVANHALEQMGGLVVGVHVAPARGAAKTDVGRPAQDPRRLRLLVRPNAGGTERSPIYAFALHERGPEPPADSGVRVGPPLLLTRGEPVAITVVNRTPEPTAVHWHGIELESYFDGVAGFSGSGKRLSPVIAPGDSFEVRMAPPRAGTFIYHTHVNEMRQQLAGLAGPLIVLHPGRRFDPATDIPVLISSPRDSVEEEHGVLLNGSLVPAPRELRVGTTYRLRFVNITVQRPSIVVELLRDTTRLTWRMVGKDGAGLPASRQGVVPARRRISIGETVDVEVTPEAPGDMRLEMRTGALGLLLATMPFRVREAGAGAP